MEPNDTYVLCPWNDGSLVLLGKDSGPEPMSKGQARLLAVQVRNSAVEGVVRTFLCTPDFNAEAEREHIWAHKALMLEEV